MERGLLLLVPHELHYSGPGKDGGWDSRQGRGA